MSGGASPLTVSNLKPLRASGAMGGSGDLKVSSGRPEFCLFLLLTPIDTFATASGTGNPCQGNSFKLSMKFPW
jgi:hypothetical protein